MLNFPEIDRGNSKEDEHLSQGYLGQVADSLSEKQDRLALGHHNEHIFLEFRRGVFTHLGFALDEKVAFSYSYHHEQSRTELLLLGGDPDASLYRKWNQHDVQH